VAIDEGDDTALVLALAGAPARRARLSPHPPGTAPGGVAALTEREHLARPVVDRKTNPEIASERRTLRASS